MSESARARSKVTDSSGSVFADLGIDLDAKDLLKFAIARQITTAVTDGGLTQAQVAEIIEADQAKVSALMRGQLKGFSLQRLIQYLLLLGYDLDVAISGNGGGKRKFRRIGRVRVRQAVAAVC